MTDDGRAPEPLHPFALRIDLLDRMLNFEIADDPWYSGLEIQGFDDPDHGRGMLVFLNRRDDGRNDVYFERGLRLDPATYAIGNGLGEWVETAFETARLDVDASGVSAEVRFTDSAGRAIDVEVGDRTPRGRRMAPFLAPAGAAVTEPRSLLLVWMSRFDLLHRAGPPPVVRIDGRDATLGRLPVEWLIRRRLIKVAADLCVVRVNPAQDDPIPLDGLDTTGWTVEGPGPTPAIVGTAGGHEARVAFDPAFPDLRSPAEVGPGDGRWSVTLDGAPVVAGEWRVLPNGDEVRVELDVSEGWKPRGLPLLMAIVTRVASVFRTWPTTYRWSATVTDGDGPTMTSLWTRTGDDRGESYRSFTQSG